MQKINIWSNRNIKFGKPFKLMDKKNKFVATRGLNPLLSINKNIKTITHNYWQGIKNILHLK